jgi:phosphoribosyl-AMP cyclohydrolase
VYYSRSRGRLWFKGEESGHVQQVHEIRLDCDNDVMLLKVTQLGPHDPSHRLPHRPPQLFLPAVQRRPAWGGRAGLERPATIYKTSKP